MCIYKCEGIARVCTRIHTLTNYTGQAWGANLPLTPHALLTQPRVLQSARAPTHAHTRGSRVQREWGWGCERVPPAPPQPQSKAAIKEAILSLQNLVLVLHLKAGGELNPAEAGSGLWLANALCNFSGLQQGQHVQSREQPLAPALNFFALVHERRLTERAEGCTSELFGHSSYSIFLCFPSHPHP